MTSATLNLSTGVTAASARISGVFQAINNSNTMGSIYTTGGNVGVNTVAPNTYLQIAGTASTYGHLFINDPNPTIWGGSIGGSAATLTLKAGYGAGGETDSQRSKFQINGWNSDANQVNAFVFKTNGDTERMRIINSGNVGIGTSAPSFTLDVVGTSRISTSLTTGAVYATNITVTNIVGTAISSGTIVLSTGLTTGTINATGLSTLTNISSTNITSATLNLSTGLTSASAQITNSTISTLCVTTTLQAIGNSNTLGSLFTTGGNVGLGTATPSYKLDIVGPNTFDAYSSLRIYNNSSQHGRTQLLLVGRFEAGNDAWSTDPRNAIMFQQQSSQGSSILTKFIMQSYSDYLGILNGSGTPLFVWASTGNVGIGTVNPSTTLDVSGTGRITTSLTTGAVYTTNITATNIVSTGLTTGTINATGLATLTNVSSTNITSATLNLSTGITAASAQITNARITNVLQATGNSNTLGSLFTTGGNIGIGIVNPNSKLHIHGDYNSYVSEPSVALTTTQDVHPTFYLSSQSHDLTECYFDIYRNTQGGLIMSHSVGYGFVKVGGGLYLSSASGTVGAAPSSSNALMTFNTNGNIGIATTSPGTTLDVSGTCRITTSLTTGALYASNMTVTNIVSTLISSGTVISNTTFQAIGNSNTLGSLFTTGGNIGIGIVNPNSKLHIHGDYNSYVSEPSVALTTTQDVHPTFYLSSQSHDLTECYFDIYRNTQGGLIMSHSVGYGFVKVGGGLYLSSASGTVGAAPSSSNALMMFNTNGNIGIANTSPSATLHVVGQTIVNNNTVGTPTLTTLGGNGSRLQIGNGSGSVLPYAIGVETANMWFSSGSGFKWYGGSSTQASMQLTSSNLVVTGDMVAFGSISDRRLKENIQGINAQIALDTVKTLRPVTFDWREDIFNEEHRGQSDVGFIAQEVEEVIPEAVSEFNEINSGVTYKNMRHERIIPYLVGSIQRLEELTNRNVIFDIEHPNNEEKRLVHSFIEGPRCDLIYRGTVQMINGRSIVNLDKDCVQELECAMTEGTFESLCRNPQYFLQNHSSFNRVKATINGNLLTIECEDLTSTDTIYWSVLAERKDKNIKKLDRTNANGYLVTEYDK